MSFSKEENVIVMDWPAQSPDLNPIENFWKILGEHCKAKNPKTTEQFRTVLKEEWSKISLQVNKNLIPHAVEDAKV